MTDGATEAEQDPGDSDTVDDAVASAVAVDDAVGPPLLEARNVVKEFPVRAGIFSRRVGTVYAVSDVSLTLRAGETLGIVGESGCGKSTLGRLLLDLITPTSGEVRLGGETLHEVASRSKREVRKRMQIVFQDPYASLNPRMTVGEIVSEPLLIHGGRSRKSTMDEVGDLLASVGLSPEHRSRYPHEFSGGQRQRVGIARALAVDPELIVLDEPVSALDVSIQAGVVNLLMDLQAERNLAYLFIAHDLSVVRHISTRVGVMYLGKLVEIGDRDDIYNRSGHPYTRALLSAVPVPSPRIEKDRQRIVLEGEVPSPIDPPSGCRFRTRCWKAAEKCAVEEPETRRPGRRTPRRLPLPRSGLSARAGGAGTIRLMLGDVTRPRRGAADIRPAVAGSAIEVGDGIWSSEGLANSYLVVTHVGRVVVNAGSPDEGAVHRRRFDEVSDAPIRLLLPVSGDVAHVGGAAAFADADSTVAPRILGVGRPSLRATDHPHRG